MLLILLGVFWGFVVCFLVRLGFELRALRLQSRQFTTETHISTPLLLIFKMGNTIFFSASNVNKKAKNRPGAVAFSCNPRYLEDEDRRIVI
jgi:hypothetical protein